MSGGDLTERVEALLARPGYAELLAAVRARLERGGDPATVTLPDLGPEARRALADTLGRRRPPAATTPVKVADLDASLRGSRVGAGLVAVLEAAGGPLADQRASRTRAQAAWEAVWEVEHRALDRPEVTAWLGGLRRRGTLRRLASDPAAATVLLHQALAVVDRLPARGIALAVLAGETVGDPHGLDHGRPLATLVMRAAAGMTECDVPASARGRRQLWAEVGVVCDPLSVSVLVLGLLLDGSDIVAEACHDHAGFGVPLRLTLHQLATTDSLRSPQRRVLVCENPAVVAAATSRAGEVEPPGVSFGSWQPTAHPLVCVEGIPDVAADRLLAGLAAGGSEIAFHADFDQGGLRIGNLLHARYGATPWRFTAADYRDAVSRVAVARGLRRVGSAAWDPALGPTMREAGLAIAEEQVLDDLLDDLVR